MLKGYAIKQKRLEYLEKTIKVIDIATRIDEEMIGKDAKENIDEKQVIDNNTLTALTLLTAESNPKEKMIVDLIMNFFDTI